MAFPRGLKPTVRDWLVYLFVCWIGLILAFLVYVPGLVLLILTRPFRYLRWNREQAHPLHSQRTGKEDVSPYPPGVTSSPHWVNGQRFHVLSAGPTAPGTPLLLLLHGWPETSHSWRHILAAQAKAFPGHRIVAPDLRGFGETTRGSASWWNSSDYRLELLLGDVEALIDTFSNDGTSVVAGHDWGGLIAYSAAAAFPDKVRKLIILDAPHPAAFSRNFTFAQAIKSHYLTIFQLPLLPEIYGSANQFAFLDTIFLHGPLAVKRGQHKGTCAAEDVEVFKWSMSRAGGGTASLNYYRNIFTYNAPLQRALFPRGHKLTMPVLVLWGEDDQALGPELNRGLDRYCGAGLTVQIFPKASHWLQQDAVEEVIQSMSAFLQQGGGAAGAAAAAAAAGGATERAEAVAPAALPAAAAGGAVVSEAVSGILSPALGHAAVDVLGHSQSGKKSAGASVSLNRKGSFAAAVVQGTGGRKEQ